jgi:hypothetical protein
MLFLLSLSNVQLFEKKCVSDTIGRFTQFQAKNAWRKKCNTTCHVRVMGSVMNRFHRCINADGRYLTGVVFKSNFVANVLNNDKHFFFQFTLLWINFNALLSTSASLTMLNESCSLLYYEYIQSTTVRSVHLTIVTLNISIMCFGRKEMCVYSETSVPHTFCSYNNSR